jgi:hypothetical protein
MNEMKATEFAISCAVRLRGDDLDPAVITARLGITPSLALKKGGTRQTAKGRVIPIRTGVWDYSVSVDGTDFEPAIEQALAPFEGIAFALTSLPGVADAILDIYATADRTPEVDSYDGAYFSFSAKQLQQIAVLNLAIDVSVSVFDRVDRAEGHHTPSTALPNP